MRVIGLDYGSKTVGVAVSDPFGWTAQGLETIRRKEENNLKSTIKRLEELIKVYDVKSIVLGFPKNMNNTAGERADKTLHFMSRIEKELDVPVIMWDERLSTLGAKRTLLEADISRNKQKKVIDKMAAVFILQGYLNSIKEDEIGN